MVKVTVNPGVCGLQTKLAVSADKKKIFSVAIDSECPHIKAMEEELAGLSGYKECLARYSDSTVYKVAEKHCKHLACPVPTAIIKGAEVACGLALARDAAIHIEE